MTDQRASHDPSDFYGSDVSALPIANGPESMPQPSIAELWRAGRAAATDDRSNAERDRLEKAHQPILEQLNVGKPRRFWRWDADTKHAFINPGQWAPADAGGGGEREREESLIWGEIARLRDENPLALPDVPANIDVFHKQVIEAAKQRRADASAVIARNDSTAGTLARLGGGIAESFNDPVTVATLPIGGAGKTVARRILLEGLAQAGVEAVQQPTLAIRRKEMGEHLTAGEAVTNIATASATGMAFQGVLAEPLTALADRVAAKLKGRMTPAENAAVHVATREGEVEATSPFTPGAGTEEHVTRAAQAHQAINAAPGSHALVEPKPVTLGSSVSDAKPVSTALRVSDSDARALFKSRVRQAESSGDNFARPIDPKTGKLLSSAQGLYQFTDGTFVAYYRRRYGAGESRAAVLAKKHDTGVQEALMDDLTADNAAMLKRIGAPETAGNLYLAHFAGQSGARHILEAAPDTPVERLLRPDAITANKFLRGKTAGEVIEWAHARMGESPRSSPTLRRQLFDTDDEWSAAQRDLDAADRNVEAVNQEAEASSKSSGDDTFAPAGREPVEDMPAIDEAAAVPGDWAAKSDAPILSPRSRWYDAWRRLEKAGSGEVEGALYHPAIGDIDVKWGEAGVGKSDGYGLAKLIAHHSEVLDNLPDILADMEVATRTANRVKLESPTHDASVRLDWDGQEQRWLITAYQREGNAPAVPVYARGAANGQASLGLGATADIASTADHANLMQMVDEWHSAQRHAGEVARPVWAMESTRGKTKGLIGAWSPERGDVSRLMVDTPGHWRAVQIEPERAAPSIDPAEAVAAVKGFDDPALGEGARTSTQSMEHDLRHAAIENPDETVRLSDQLGEQRIGDVLDDLDRDDAALTAARACMAPKT